ncbi:MAG TPA: VOC family protein [Gemmatimonadaceae bacterium]|nr:VOC family protein [Gemmatimonadaceae bacterium]
MATGTRKPGDFCWINMLTPRPAEATAFFGKLLGWTYAEIPGMGYLVRVGGRDIGGVFDLESPNTPPGTPPLIGVMLKVQNADATCDRITSLGGSSKPAFDIADQGRMAVCFDPNGAEFDVWEPKKGQGTDVDSSLPGAPSWFHTLTTDVDRATSFYSGLFGWTAEVRPSSGMAYTSFKLGDDYVAGMMPISQAAGAARPNPHWTTYFTVQDVDSAVRETITLGGTVRAGPRDISGVGRVAGITSPQGVPFNVIAR